MKKLILIFLAVIFCINFITAFEVGVEYNSGIICSPNPNEFSCKYNNLYKCSAEGNDIELVKECQQGCEVVRGKPYAKCKEDPSPLIYSTDNWKSYFPTIILIIGIVIIILILIILKERGYNINKARQFTLQTNVLPKYEKGKD